MKKDGPFPMLRLDAPGAELSYPRRVWDVIEVTVAFLCVSPRLVAIHAHGRTATSGWTNPHLQPFIYIQPPVDGIWDFVFVATPPAGISFDVLTPVGATFIMPLADGVNFKGVRIHAATNSVEAQPSLSTPLPDLNKQLL